jgi:hypothetical protein
MRETAETPLANRRVECRPLRLAAGPAGRKIATLAAARLGGRLLERWLSGRKRRFAKSVKGLNPSAGSNPVLSAERVHWGSEAYGAANSSDSSERLAAFSFDWASLRSIAAPHFAARSKSPLVTKRLIYFVFKLIKLANLLRG